MKNHCQKLLSTVLIGLSLLGAHVPMQAGLGASKQVDPTSATYLVNQLKPLLHSNNHDVLRFIVYNLYRDHLTPHEADTHLGADTTTTYDEDYGFRTELVNPCLEGALQDALNSDDNTIKAAIAQKIQDMLNTPDGLNLEHRIREFLQRFQIIDFSTEGLSPYQRIALFVIMAHEDYLFQPEATDYNTAVLNALLEGGAFYNLTERPSTSSSSSMVYFCQFIKLLVSYRMALFGGIDPSLHPTLIKGLRSLNSLREMGYFAQAFGLFRSSTPWFCDLISQPIEQLNDEAANGPYRRLIDALFAPNSVIRNRGFLGRMEPLIEQAARVAFPLAVAPNHNGELIHPQAAIEVTHGACPSALYILIAILLTMVAVGTQSAL